MYIHIGVRYLSYKGAPLLLCFQTVFHDCLSWLSTFKPTLAGCQKNQVVRITFFTWPAAIALITASRRRNEKSLFYSLVECSALWRELHGALENALGKRFNRASNIYRFQRIFCSKTHISAQKPRGRHLKRAKASLLGPTRKMFK